MAGGGRWPAGCQRQTANRQLPTVGVHGTAAGQDLMRNEMRPPQNPESAGVVGAAQPSLGPGLIFKPDEKYKIWAEVTNQRYKGQWVLRPGVAVDMSIGQ